MPWFLQHEPKVGPALEQQWGSVPSYKSPPVKKRGEDARRATVVFATPSQAVLHGLDRVARVLSSDLQELSGAGLFHADRQTCIVPLGSTPGMYKVRVVARRAAVGCQLPQYFKLRLGYTSLPRTSSTRLMVGCHVLVLLAYWGPPAPGPAPGGGCTSWVCMHLCGNSLCLNPWHLCWGSYTENRAREDLGQLYSSLAARRQAQDTQAAQAVVDALRGMSLAP